MTNLVVIDGGKDKHAYTHYSGKRQTKNCGIESSTPLSPDEIEALRKDPINFIYGEPEAVPA